MAIDERQINAIVDAVVSRLSSGTRPAAPAAEGRKPGASADYVPTYGKHRHDSSGKGKKGVFEDMDSAVAAARVAHEALLELSFDVRAKCIQAMREVTAKNVQELARRAVEETGLGNYEDKIKKNLLVAWKTPGVEILRPLGFTGDHGLTLVERAPFGVIGSITPTTNPTETILNNAIGMIAGGNSVVFNVHPSAKNVVSFFVQKLNESIVAAGGPSNLLCMIGSPTIESAGALMKHPGIRLIVVTGGPAVVKAAMNSGKRAICGGPGNPPAVVDETAHIARAAKDSSIADELKSEMLKHGAFEVPSSAINRLEKLVVDEGHAARDWVGKDATKIAEAAGIRCPSGTRLLFAEVDPTHSFIQAELLMPVIGFARLKTVEDCIAAAVQAEHGFGHTATMHSTNIDVLSAMAKIVNTSIFVKNGPSFAGLGMTGEGYTSFTIASPTGEGLTTPTPW